MSAIMLSVVMLSVTFHYCCPECDYSEFCYAEWHYAKCRYSECHYAECRYVECRSTRREQSILLRHENNYVRKYLYSTDPRAYKCRARYSALHKLYAPGISH
jgi:hypothetical protein